MGGRGAGSGGGIESFTVSGIIRGQKVTQQYYRIGKDGIGAGSLRSQAEIIKGASFSKGLARARKNGTIVKERTKSQIHKEERKAEKDYKDYRKEVERRKDTNPLLGTGTLNRHGKSINHRAKTRGEDFLITFSEWKRQNRR